MAVILIADDLTGANDSIVKFATWGARAVTVFNKDNNRVNSKIEGYDVHAYSTDSRGISKDDAYRQVYDLIKALFLTEDDLIYKKIDSGLRGNIGSEIEAVLNSIPWAEAVLVCPASPENRRITIDGRQLIDCVPVGETEMAHDPVSPVQYSYIPTILGSQSDIKTGHIPLSTVSKGIGFVKKHYDRLIGTGCRIIVSDASRDEHLLTLAELILNYGNIVPCGSAGLAKAIAMKKGKNPTHPVSPIAIKSPGKADRRSLFVIGSKSPVSRLQIEKLREWVPKVGILSLNLSKEPKESIDFAIENMLSLSGRSWKGNALVLDISPWNKNVDSELLITTLAEIVRRLTKHVPIDSLFIAGGDTAAAVLEKTDTHAVTMEYELETGICAGTIIGGQFDGVEIVTKAGSFGDEMTLVRILKRTIDSITKKRVDK